MHIIKCPVCGHDNKDQAITCINCGSSLMNGNYLDLNKNPNMNQSADPNMYPNQNGNPYMNQNGNPYMNQNANPYMAPGPYGNQYSPYYNQYGRNNDHPDTLANVFSFLIPLVGLIIYLSDRNVRPIMAASAGKYALYGFVTGLVFGFILRMMGISI